MPLFTIMMPAAGATYEPVVAFLQCSLLPTHWRLHSSGVAALSGQLDALRGGASCGFM